MTPSNDPVTPVSGPDKATRQHDGWLGSRSKWLIRKADGILTNHRDPGEAGGGQASSARETAGSEPGGLVRAVLWRSGSCLTGRGCLTSREFVGSNVRPAVG